MDKNFSVLDFLTIFLRRKKKIFVHFFVVTVVAIAVSFIVPKNYKAMVLFFPPYDEAPSFGGISLGSVLSTGKNSAFTSPQIESLLDSRRLLEAAIAKFDLLHVYKTWEKPNKNELALKKLRKQVKVSMVEETGLTQSTVTYFSVSVIDEDRERSADLANFLVTELGRAMNELSKEQDNYAEVFIKGRLDSTSLQKEKIQADLAKFQKVHKIYSSEIGDQLAASISTYAALKQRKMMAEIKREMLLFDQENGSRDVRLINREITELNKKMQAVEQSRVPDAVPGLNYSVDIAAEYIGMLQEAEVLAKLELLLRQQYEEAHIKNARLAPSIRIVDRATPPEWKNFPKKAYIVLGIVGVYMFFLLLSVFASHGLAQATPETHEKLRKFREALRLRAG